MIFIKLLQIVPQTEEFRALIQEVRSVRAMTNICPSAQSEVNVSEMLNFLIENEIYKDDYEKITARILEEEISSISQSRMLHNVLMVFMLTPSLC